MELGTLGAQGNGTYGLHIPTKFSILVVHQLGLIAPSELGTYKRIFNFRLLSDRERSQYVAPVDLSQLMVPYKTYRAVEELEEGPYQMRVAIRVYPMTYYTIFFGFSRPEMLRQVNPLMAHMYTDDMIDMLKEALFTNSFYLVVAYFLLSFTQIFMNIFAFKN